MKLVVVVESAYAEVEPVGISEHSLEICYGFAVADSKSADVPEFVVVSLDVVSWSYFAVAAVV